MNAGERSLMIFVVFALLLRKKLSLNDMNEKSAHTKRTTLFIYTMGRTIQVKNEYMEANFKRHPIIATVYNYHLFSNRAPTSKFVK